MVKIFKASKTTKIEPTEVNYIIEKLDLNGAGIARSKKIPVFIERALAGEQVTAKIIEQKSKWAKAKLIKVITPSADRIAAKCKHFALCGGCDLQHMQYQAQLEFKQQKISQLLKRNANYQQALPWQAPISSDPYGYRRKARLGVQYNKQQQPMVGFRRKASNQLCQITQCDILLPNLQALLPALIDVVQQLPAHSIGHFELLYVEQVIVVVRQLTNLTKQAQQIWLAFAKQNQAAIAIQTDNDIFWLTDPAELSYQLNENIELQFELKDFIQVNHQVNLAMVTQALAWLAPSTEDTVLDLFSGIGNFSVPLAKCVKKVVGIEGVTTMVQRAQANAKHNQLTNCEFYTTDLNADWSDESWAQYHYDAVLLDPARAGAYQALEQLVSKKISRLLYVSCDPATLARDSQLLLEQGYQIKKIGIMDMFSQTKHVETMILFSNQK